AGDRSLYPKPDKQGGIGPTQFPTNEKQKQTVRHDQAEHRAGEERQVREETGEIFVLGHVADAEDKNAEADERDHHQHRGSKRIEDKSEAQSLFTERE